MINRTVLGAILLSSLLFGCPEAKNEELEHSEDDRARSAKTASTSPAGSEDQLDERVVVAVDARVELLSLLFRLAGAPEYNRGPDTPYARAVQKHFTSFKDHEAVVASRQLRAKNGISHNAPVALAAHLDAIPSLKPRHSLAPVPTTLDPRWQGVDIDAYLATVRKFVADSGFEKFIATQQSYFRAVEARFRRFVANKKILAWYDEVLERSTAETFHLVPGLMSGVFNYGVGFKTAAGKEQHYQVLMLEQVDAKGMPSPTEQTEALLVHEMAHPFVNPLVDKHRKLFEPSASRIFAMVEEPMSRQAYKSWKTMVDESIVRALTVLYLHDRMGKAAGNRAAAADQKRAFHWIVDVTQVLARRRAKGKIALDALMPELAAAMDKWLAAHPTGPG